MEKASFKERVKKAAIENALVYEESFVKYEYLVCSKAYDKGYYIIKSDRSNYLHLIGIHTDLTAEHFFEKCMSTDDNQLKKTDFDFIKAGRDETAVKGSVRKKIKVLPHIANFFCQMLLTEERFQKNHVECDFATSDNRMTLGFVKEGRPKTLLKGNELDSSRQKKIDFVFRKLRGSRELYAEMIYGDIKKIDSYYENIKNLVDEKFFVS